jgi:hypothetical protein
MTRHRHLAGLLTSDTPLETIFVTYLRYFRRRLCFIQHNKYMLCARDCSWQLLVQLIWGLAGRQKPLAGLGRRSG